MTTATTFHLVRHGDFGLLGRALAGRTPGHSLSTLGHEQAEQVALVLAARPLAAIVAGPLERVREMAAPLGRRAGLAVGVDPDFDEIDFGEWTGLGFDALHANEAWRVFNRLRGFVAPPGGEAMADVLARSLGGLRRLADEHRGAEIALFTHADIIKALLAHFLCTPLDLLPRIEISPGARSVLTVYDEDARVGGVNLPPGS